MSRNRSLYKERLLSWPSLDVVKSLVVGSRESKRRKAEEEEGRLNLEIAFPFMKGLEGNPEIAGGGGLSPGHSLS